MGDCEMKKLGYVNQLCEIAWMGALLGWLVVAFSPIIGLGIVYLCLGVGITMELRRQVN
ncbi:MAG: hypothetical protein ACRCW2_12590 [Cellulosilyticaceae bacterium]